MPRRWFVGQPARRQADPGPASPQGRLPTLVLQSLHGALGDPTTRLEALSNLITDEVP